MVTPIINRRPAPSTAPITAIGGPDLVDLVSGVSVSVNPVSGDPGFVIHVAGEDCPENCVVTTSWSEELVILKSVVPTISGYKHNQFDINIIIDFNLFVLFIGIVLIMTTANQDTHSVTQFLWIMYYIHTYAASTNQC